MDRKRIAFLILAVVVLAAVGSWLIGSSIQSPAEVAARTAPPTPSPILIPVEERVLSSDVVTRGTARYGLPQSISIVPSVLKAGAAVITTLPERGAQLKEGSLLLTASGRPVFVLQGDTPTYRDLAPGVFGDDVRQLEAALARLGFAPGPVDGEYDQETSKAVNDWYRSAGWQSFGPTAEQTAKIRAFEQELARAQHNKLTAADAAVAAPQAVEAARANAKRANKAAAADVAAKAALHDKILADRKTTEADRVRVQADLDLAEAAATATQLAGEVQIQAALNAQRSAEREAKMAAEIADRIAAELEVAKSKTGFQVPADEFVFIPSLPVRVEDVSSAVGDAASGAVLTVTNNILSIDAALALDEAHFVKPGMPVGIDEPALGIKASGVVKRVADTPGTDGVDGYHIYFETLVQESSASLEGFSLRLTIQIKSTGGKVLAVPVSAVSLAADGKSRVQVDENGTFKYINVEPGLSAEGYVEVTPINGTLSPGQLVVVGYENSDE